MDIYHGNVTSGQDAALVMLAFLQADCVTNSVYEKELSTLGQEIQLTRDINYNALREDYRDSVGDLETDGHQASCIANSLSDIQPSVDLQWPGNRADAAAVHRVAEELRDIAAQLEDSVVAHATRSLSSNIMSSPPHTWKAHISQEVDRMMRRGVNLNDIPQERVIVALTLTLVKGVCEKTPGLLRRLFDMALQCISVTGTR